VKTLLKKEASDMLKTLENPYALQAGLQDNFKLNQDKL
jgi:hypothetical protein